MLLRGHLIDQGISFECVDTNEIDANSNSLGCQGPNSQSPLPENVLGEKVVIMMCSKFLFPMSLVNFLSR